MLACLLEFIMFQTLYKNESYACCAILLVLQVWNPFKHPRSRCGRIICKSNSIELRLKLNNAMLTEKVDVSTEA